MRILWLGHNLAYPPVRGVLQRTFNLLKEASRRCEVHVLAFDQPGTRPSGVNPEDCIYALKKFCKSVEWVPLSQGRRKSGRYWLALRGVALGDPFDIQWLRSHQLAEKLENILQNTRFDVVHFDTLGLAQYRPIVRNAATVLNHHNIESAMMARRASNGSNIFTVRYFRGEAQRLGRAENHWCPKFDVNLVVSHEEDEVLRLAVPGVRTAVVANGADTDYFSPRPDPGGRTLLFCGGLDWYPNADAMRLFFKETWPRLTARIRDVEIYVVGRRPPSWLLQLSAKDGRIHVPGFVSDVRPYFKKATVYVCPIRDGGGTRLKVLDSLAMGVPLVGTPFACSGLTARNGKHVLLAETPERFVHQIQELIGNIGLRRDLAAAGRELVECHYSWKVIGNNLVETYKEACIVRSAANI